MCWVAAIVVPGLITTLMVSHYYGAEAACTFPAFNDEVSHWHQIKTFSEAQFQGGYYTWNEKAAKFAFSHFGNWGMGFAVVMGSIAKLFGWHASSAMPYNVTLITIALALMILVTGPDVRQTALLIAFTATTWPLLLYLPRTMETSLHISFGVLFAVVFYVREAYPKWRRYAGVGFVVLLAAAAMVQFTWLLVTFAWLLWRGGTRRQIVMRVGVAITICFLGASYFRLTIPPYPNDPLGDLLRAGGVTSAINQIAKRFTYIAALRGDIFENILWVQCFVLLAMLLFRSRARIRSWFADSLIARPRLVVLVSLAIIAAALLIGCSELEWGRARYLVPPAIVLLYPAVRKMVSKIAMRVPHHGNPTAPIDSGLAVAGLLVFIPLGISIVAGFPDGHRAYRLVAPFMTAACLLLILRREYRLVLAITAVALVGAPDFFRYYERLQPWHSCAGLADIRAFEKQIQPYIKYDPTEGPWCNTLLFELNSFQPPLIAVPAGVGLSFIYDTSPVHLDTPLRSKYVLVGSNFRQMLEARGVNLQPLTNTQLGVLYQNMAASCTH